MRQQNTETEDTEANAKQQSRAQQPGEVLSGYHVAPSLSPPCSGVLLAVGLATTLLMHLGLKLRPSLAQACLMRAPRPQWRGLGKPHVPTEYAPLRDR